MTPVYLNPQQSSSITFLDLKVDQQHSLPTIMGYVHDHVTNTNNTYFSSSNLANHYATTEFLAMDYSRCTQEKVVEKLILSHDKPFVYPFDHGYHGDHNIEITKTVEKPEKCKPSKLRIMQRASTTNTAKSKKTITGDHKRHYDHHLAQPKQSNTYRKTSNEANNNGIRMCTDCHTTTTPLWRSGPQGPKSLCNACGIRQRKARRAAMAATGFAKDDNLVTSPMSSTTTFEAPKLLVEDTSSQISLVHDDKSHTLPLKKRSKTLNASWSYNNITSNDDDNSHYGEKLSFQDYSKATSSQRVFPKDEEEGAILLMALSCGLPCSS